MNNADEVLGTTARLVTVNTKTMSMLGARVMVLGRFLDAALPQLTTPQRVEVTRSFRRAIGEAMSCMDDVALPAEYHAALLDLTNTILAPLNRELAVRE